MFQLKNNDPIVHNRLKVIDIMINITSKGCESNNIIKNDCMENNTEQFLLG